MAIETIYKLPKQAYLFDHIIQNLQDALGSLSWLNHIFGRSERLVQLKDGVRKYSPNVYGGKDNYISLLPDNTYLGNYCFFVLEEPQTISVPMQQLNRVRAPFSLIVWVDMRRVGASYDDRNTEKLKEDIIKTIRTAWVKKGGVTLNRIYERAENVFNGYSLDEVDNQFLMSPFAGFRFTGEFVIDEDCSITQ